MSLEQVLGKQLDPRTDLFSFGRLLYEKVNNIYPVRSVGSVNRTAVTRRR